MAGEWHGHGMGTVCCVCKSAFICRRHWCIVSHNSASKGLSSWSHRRGPRSITVQFFSICGEQSSTGTGHSPKNLVTSPQLSLLNSKKRKQNHLMIQDSTGTVFKYMWTPYVPRKSGCEISSGPNNSRVFPLSLSLLLILILISRKLPSILTQTIHTFRIVVTDTQSTVYDIF